MHQAWPIGSGSPQAHGSWRRSRGQPIVQQCLICSHLESHRSSRMEFAQRMVPSIWAVCTITVWSVTECVSFQRGTFNSAPHGDMAITKAANFSGELIRLLQKSGRKMLIAG